MRKEYEKRDKIIIIGMILGLEELLEMAAFLGEQIVKYKGGSWKLWKMKK